MKELGISKTKNYKDSSRSRDFSLDRNKEGKKGIIILSRLGYAAKGVVYIIIGFLALQTAIGTGGNTTGARGALKEIASQSFGQILLAVVALGLVGYVIWRIIQTIKDPDNNGTDFKGIIKRTAYFISGLIHLGLVYFAVQLIIGSGGSGSGGQSSQTTSSIMSQPFGRWLVGLIGAVVIGAGIYQFYNGIKEKFKEKMKMGEMNNTEQTWSVRLGKIGLMARGVVFGIIGVFFAQAAIAYNPDKAGGLGKALDTLSQQSYGPYLLGVVALGLISYGIYMFALAKYRKLY